MRKPAETLFSHARKIITTQLQGALIRMLDSDFLTKILENPFKDGYRPHN
jgi:hypothetical protein